MKKVQWVEIVLSGKKKQIRMTERQAKILVLLASDKQLGWLYKYAKGETALRQYCK